MAGDDAARLNRRQALALVTAGALLTPGLKAAAQSATRAAAERSGPGPVRQPAAVQLLITQRAWEADDLPASLEPLLRSIAEQSAPGDTETLVLLPRAEPPGEDLPAEDRLLADLGRLARRHRLWLAGAAPVRSDGRHHSIGFVLAPDGGTGLRTVKTTPDVFDGFTDTRAGLDTPAAFPTVETPFGKLGLLVGEDALVPGLVRGAMLAGAELLLNPSAGEGPGTGETLRELPQAMAYENWFAVAVAAPLTRKIGEVSVAQASRSGWFDLRGNSVRADAGQELIAARFDVEPLRLARARVSADIYDNFPTWLRSELYAQIYTHQAQLRGPSAQPATRSAWHQEARRRIEQQQHRRTPADRLEDYFLALIAQPATMSSLPKEGRRDALISNIDTALGTVGRVAGAPNARLALFPEFCFTGAGYRSVPDMLNAAVELPGPELERLQQWSRDHRLYCAAEFLEADPKFPGRAFNTAVLLDDQGALILKHRKLQCVDIMGALPDTTPGSIYDDYVAEYGIEDLYAVADTPLGKIGVIICFEINMPEILRAMAHEGVEIILHLTAEGYGCDRAMWHAQRRKRAFENQAYLLCANQGWDVSRREPWVPYGESQIIDFRGRERDRLADNNPGLLIAPVDMAALRAARQDPRLNLGIWDDPAAYAHAYRQGPGVPNNLWLNRDPLVSPYVRTGTLEATRDRYYASGTYTRPRQRG